MCAYLFICIRIYIYVWYHMILYYVNLCSIPFYYGIIYFSQQPYHIILFVICHVDIDIKYTHEHLYIWCSPFAVWYIKVFASRQVVRDPGKALKKLTPIEHLMTGGAAGGIDSLTIHGTGLTMNILFGCHGKLKGIQKQHKFFDKFSSSVVSLVCVCVCLWQPQKKPPMMATNVAWLGLPAPIKPRVLHVGFMESIPSLKPYHVLQSMPS